MRRKLLLFLMMVSFGALYAQSDSDTIWHLIISEARFDRANNAYIELTNMGPAVNLGEFELVSMTPWTTFPNGELWQDNNYFNTEPTRDDGRWTMLPDMVLDSGESFVVSSYHDWLPEQRALDYAKVGYSEDYEGPHNKNGVEAVTDMFVHRAEDPAGGPTDSISDFNYLLESWGGGRDAIFLVHHPAAPGSDSCTVDVVNGWFSDDNGSNPDPNVYKAIAGVPRATGVCLIVRQFHIKEGNRKWTPGNDLAESEWIPVPLLYVRPNGDGDDNNRALFWTVGNHQDSHLNDTTLVSETIEIDWTVGAETMTVPYGVRNNDSIMSEFTYEPGIAWHYDFNNGANASLDSAYSSVRTGDTLTVMAVGNTLEKIDFHLIAAPPTKDANWVIPKKRRDYDDDQAYSVNGEVYKVSHMMKEGVLDTISEIPFACRIDSLYKFLEKPPLATWDIVWVDGDVRTDLKHGDKLKVTAEDGSVKEYFLKLRKYRKARNADLAYITWPDIPIKGLYGWVGDTIPGFNPSVLDYRVQLPPNTTELPALVAKNVDDNASHTMTRATNLFGTEADRTVSILSVAENDTTDQTYNIVLEKILSPNELQPWEGETFISQYVYREDWSNNFLELVNPGNQVMEMSNYMIYGGSEHDPAVALAIDGSADDGYSRRYMKYIPGYVWDDNWDVNKYIAVEDPAVNATVFPGDVFVMGYIPSSRYDDPHIWAKICDIDFANNPWGVDQDSITANCTETYEQINMFVWRIDNPEVLAGTKAATDPADFTLIDTWSMGEADAISQPIGANLEQCASFTRRKEIYHGNPEIQGSFGATEEESEWTLVTRAMLDAQGYGWPDYHRHTPDGTGSHFMDPVTIFKSTVGSVVYLVTRGFTMEETITGVVTGTTVKELWEDNLNTFPGQTYVVKRGDVVVGEDDPVLDGDVLEVTSQDGTNTSGYILAVSDGGLSDDAVLTSTSYVVTTDETAGTGTVAGMMFGETVKNAVAAVTVPVGAALTVVDADDAYVPLKRLNFDTVYVDVQVTDEVFFDVVAQDGVTSIKYQLTPDVAATDAFVYSDVYMVDQDKLLISLVPKGCNVETFLSNLVPTTGATIQLYDKLDYERNSGEINMDDKLVVTSEDTNTETTYYLTILNEAPNYLAYVVSDVYLVDEDDMTITGVDAKHNVTTFSGNVTPAEGATMEVQNSGGTAKAGTDQMAQDDMLQVTAGNGVNIVSYTVSVIVGIEDMDNEALSIYPNPTNGMLNIANAEIGSRIRVYNAVGSAVADIEVNSGLETISLESHSAGMYFVTIMVNDEVSGTYKVIKQ